LLQSLDQGLKEVLLVVHDQHIEVVHINLLYWDADPIIGLICKCGGKGYRRNFRAFIIAELRPFRNPHRSSAHDGPGVLQGS
ncbi:MAG: hypothetical protein JXL84_11310, partial [Deltaproteobacteria bacterium]|nr:hypothetical protein [Deltaproteobacteria bacterium]